MSVITTGSKMWRIGRPCTRQWGCFFQCCMNDVCFLSLTIQTSLCSSSSRYSRFTFHSLKWVASLERFLIVRAMIDLAVSSALVVFPSHGCDIKGHVHTVDGFAEDGVGTTSAPGNIVSWWRWKGPVALVEIQEVGYAYPLSNVWSVWLIDTFFCKGVMSCLLS